MLHITFYDVKPLMSSFPKSASHVSGSSLVSQNKLISYIKREFHVDASRSEAAIIPSYRGKIKTKRGREGESLRRDVCNVTESARDENGVETPAETIVQRRHLKPGGQATPANFSSSR